MKQKFLNTKKEIIEWLNKYNIKNYTLIPDKKYGFVINIDGDVILTFRSLDFIPVKFNIVSGNFYCYNNKLTTLEFSPINVGGSFYCSQNKLSSLEFGPINVGGSFYCPQNKLTSLKFCPNIVGADFNCSYNKLTSLEFSPINVGGSFYCSYNKLTSLEFSPINVGGHFYCNNNKIKNYVYFPQKVAGFILLKKDNKHIFEEAYKIHIKDKSEYEKQILSQHIFNEKSKNNQINKNKI